MPAPKDDRPTARSFAVGVSQFVAAEQGKCEEGQRPVGGDGLGEGSRIADARHRTLHNGIARAMPLGQRRTFGQRRQTARCLNVLGHALTQRLHDAADGTITLGERLGECRILADQPQTIGISTVRQRWRNCDAGAGETAVRFPQSVRDTLRLAAVEGGQPPLRFFGQGRFAGQ